MSKLVMVTQNEGKNVIAKKLNQMNQDELKAIILELDTKEGAADIKAIEDKKLSAAKQKQELINCAAENLGDDYEVGVAAKPNPKKDANVVALVAASYVANEAGDYTNGAVTIAAADIEKSTAKQLVKLMNPPAPKEEFKGYTPEQIAAFASNVNKAATFKASGRHDAKLDKNGHVTGVIKSQKQEARSGKTYYEIAVVGMAKTAWTRDTNSTLVIGDEVAEVNRPWYKAPK